MRKMLALIGILLLIAEMFRGSSSVRAVILPYLRHQRYPFRKGLQRSFILAQTIPLIDMDRYLHGALLMTQKRSQPDTDFDYVNDFDPTQIFL